MNSTYGYDRLALSFKAMGGGLWDYDLQADSLYCNDRWYEIMGVCAASDPVRSIADLGRHVHPEDVEIAIAVDFDLVSDLLARDERYHIEFRVVRANGDIRWVRSVACIIRDGAGHLRAVGCITDITEFRSLGVEPHDWAGPEGAEGLSEGRERRRYTGPERRRTPRGPPVPLPEAENPLSERECECLLWVSMGKTAWETASILGRSQRTVEFHLRNAIRKLGAANKIHATALAIRQGML